jgi:hypothetical protein
MAVNCPGSIAPQKKNESDSHHIFYFKPFSNLIPAKERAYLKLKMSNTILVTFEKVRLVPIWPESK